MNETQKMIAISTLTFASMALIVLAVVFVMENSYRLRPGYAWDTLRIRCEEEQGGVLIGKNCFKKEAIQWSRKDI